MKIRKPSSRNDLSIKKNYKVLDVGGGHNPHPRANVVVDKFVDDNTHRSGDIKVLSNQKFVHAGGENLPFEDRAFDYIICTHVLEHVDNPIKFVEEQARISPRGYMETPSLLGEYLAPKESHKWVLLEVDNKIVMYEKEKINFKTQYDFGEVFLTYLPKISLAFKLLERTQPDLLTIRHEWENEVEILVNPEDSYYYDFFTKPWSPEFFDKVFEKRTFAQEGLATVNAFFNVVKCVFKSKVLKKH